MSDRHSSWRHIRLRAILVISALIPLALAGGAYAQALDKQQETPISVIQGGEEDQDPRSDLTGPLEMKKMELEEAAIASGVGGLATINADYDADTLHLFWKGDVPATLSAAIRKISSPFHVVVHSAPYTWTEVEREVRTILALVENDAELKFIVGVGMESDITGIRLLTSHPDTEESVKANALSVIRKAMSLPLPLRYEFRDWATNLIPAEGRWDDESPFTGGAVISSSESSCTTAFAVKNTGNTRRGILTARHCGEESLWFGSRWAGFPTWDAQGQDIIGMLWDVSDVLRPPFEGKIYTGSYLSAIKNNIDAVSYSGLDQSYCTSGAFSGIRCNNTVIDRNLFFPDPIGGPNFVTQHNSGLAAAGSGDSGGPSYRLWDGLRYAKGVMSAIDANRLRSCQGVPTSAPTRVCSDTVVHAEVQHAFVNSSVRLWTGSS